ncbi:hypothetical protein HU200_058197 [Digitaria exilis]|uniref:Ubiquitin-like protease family profile domain-containing protein n=1 Tax=Digitaria exilis TaxID=1010633 RepID=A0A835E265_9POAL|nr:hypothetical protein HU200_058197 [Digitaria exilis]
MEENAEGGLESVDMKVSRHNKPKKVHVKVICAQDKQIIKSIGGLGDDRTVVRVGDAFVTMHNFKCLLERSEYLNGDVINAYINLIAAEKHLLYRDGSSIYLENSLTFYILYRDGRYGEKSKPSLKEDTIVERVTNYVSHDMVFIPINIERTHWYLGVISGKKREIQVLDSMGKMGRDELTYAGDMEKFRLKLAAILLESDNNTAIESEDTESNADETIDPNEFYAYNKEWVISSNPYPITVNLEKLQGILNVNMPMDRDIFNLGARMLACDVLTSFREPKCHFLDLKFFWDCNYRRHPLHRVKPEPKKLATYFDVWPNSGVTFSECQLVFVPYRSCESYGVFALDRKDRIIAIIDPTPFSQWNDYNHPSFYYLPKIQKIAKTYERAMEEVDPMWNDDVYDWRHIFPSFVPKTMDRLFDGFLVLELMNSWDGQLFHRLLRADARMLRKWFLIEALKFTWDRCAPNIPEDLKAALHSIGDTRRGKYI